MPTDISYARVPNGNGPMKYQNHTYNYENQPISSTGDLYHHNRLRVYPNPSHTRVYILGNTELIRVFNMMGQEVYCNTQVNSIDISHWESGIYFIKSEEDIVKIIKR